MNVLQLPIPEYRRKGFSLIGHALSLFFKNALPILFIVAFIALPIEAIKNFYFFEPDDSALFFPNNRMDNFVNLLFLSAITPMIVHYILGRMTATGTGAGIKPSLLWGLKKWPRMIVYNFLHSAIIVAGIIVFIIPGLLFIVWLMLLPIIVSVMDTSRVNPMTISRDMARKRYFKLVLYGLAAFLALAALIIAQGLLFSFFVSQTWITATLFDVCFSWIYQLVTVVLLLVFLQVKTERDDQPQDAIDQAS